MSPRPYKEIGCLVVGSKGCGKSTFIKWLYEHATDPGTTSSIRKTDRGVVHTVDIPCPAKHSKTKKSFTRYVRMHLYEVDPESSPSTWPVTECAIIMIDLCQEGFGKYDKWVERIRQQPDFVSYGVRRYVVVGNKMDQAPFERKITRVMQNVLYKDWDSLHDISSLDGTNIYAPLNSLIERCKRK